MAEIDSMVGGGGVDELVRTATTLPGAGVDIDKLVKGQTDIQREKVAATDEVRGRTVNRLNQDAEQAREKLQGVGSLDEVPNWDADKEMSQRGTSSLDAFGSFGSVFAIAASAFTRQPMVNALNGSAAAMNAIRDRDEKGYDKAYKAWQDNTKLAIKRNEIQQQAFQNAIQMINVDSTVGTAELKAVAEQFGDKATLAALEAGYLDKAIEIQTARQKSAQGIIGAIPGIETMYLQRKLDTLKGKPEKTDDERRQIDVLEERMNIRRTADQEIIRRAKDENPSITAEELGDLVRNSRKEKTPEQQAADKWNEENPNGTAAEFKAYMADWKARNGSGRGATGMNAVQEKAVEELINPPDGSPGISRIEAIAKVRKAMVPDRPNAQNRGTLDAAGIKEEQDRIEKETGVRPSIAEAKKSYEERSKVAKPEGGSAQRARGIREIQEQNPGMSVADATAKFDRTSRVPSANRMDDINRQVAQYDHNISLFDKALDILEEKTFTAGLGGRAGRMKERIGNVLGTNDDTDRVQFMRYLNELKMHAPQLLADRSGRPMAAEIKKVDDVIAGISSGDTTANTIRALEELRATYKQQRRTNIKRREGQPLYDAAGESTAAGEKPTEAAPTAKPSWQSAPLVGDR